MATQTTFSMRIDSELKQKLQTLAEDLGVSVSSLVTMQLWSLADPHRVQFHIGDGRQEGFDFEKEHIDQDEFLETLSSLNQK